MSTLAILEKALNDVRATRDAYIANNCNGDDVNVRLNKLDFMATNIENIYSEIEAL